MTDEKLAEAATRGAKMKIKELTFPLTPEAFSAYQGQGVGRELTELEQEVMAIWVPIFNGSYADGKAGDKQALLESVSRMNQVISEHRENEILTFLLKSFQWWIVYAWTQGRGDGEQEGR